MTNENVTTSFERQNPRYWWQRTSPPTALQLAAAELEECRRDYLQQKKLAEYHTSTSKMLIEREKRLLDDITRLSKNPILAGEANI